MSISGALSNAMSGLRAAGRGSEIVSSNIANAMTPGYGRRLLTLSSQTVGVAGGVRVDGITRIVDAGLASDKRLADAELGNLTATTGFLTRFESLLGTPDQPYALSARLSGFESSLIAAASRPDASDRLELSVIAARDLAGALGDASKGVQDARSSADRSIDTQVSRLNAALSDVQRLNAQITRTLSQGNDTASLQDLRQRLVDEISAIAPVREVPRDNGAIALYSTGGAILLDGSAATLSFDPVNLVTAAMSIDAGSLSGLKINGIDVRTSSDRGALRGGTLGAQFEIRDELGVSAQTQLDAVARDLVERFQDPAVDPTLVPGNPGLFTDAGLAFDPVDEVGLSGRLAINAAVDPDQGGAVWRLRDGINATGQGNVGNASLLTALGDALGQRRVQGSGDFGGGAFDATNLVSVLTSHLTAARGHADQSLSFAATRAAELTQMQLSDGVDTDSELQRLMIIEQAYAENVRVIEAADEMMQTILRL